MTTADESTPRHPDPLVVQETQPPAPAAPQQAAPSVQPGHTAPVPQGAPYPAQGPQYGQPPSGQTAQYGQQPFGQPAQYPVQQYGQPAQYAVQQYGQPQPGQPQYAQPGYGQPVYVAPYVYTPSPPRGLSISSMVIGLVSLFFGFTFVLPIIGFVLGIMGARKEPTGRAMAITGIVLNGFFLLAWVALVLLWVFIIGGLFVGIGGAASTGISA